MYNLVSQKMVQFFTNLLNDNPLDSVSGVYGFNYQEWGNCAQYALTHALLLFGYPITINKAHHLTKTSRDAAAERGTDSYKIVNAISKSGFHSVEENYDNETDAKNAIDKALSEQKVCIVCADDYSHWAVIAEKLPDNTYVWIDSADDELIGTYTWDDLNDWIAYSEPEEDEEWAYSFIVIDSLNKTMNQKINVRDLLLASQDEDLFYEWGKYLIDLQKIFTEPKGPNALSADEVFNSSFELVKELIIKHVGLKKAKQIRREINRYSIVAKTHNLFVNKDNLETELVKLSVYIAARVF